MRTRLLLSALLLTVGCRPPAANSIPAPLFGEGCHVLVQRARPEMRPDRSTRPAFTTSLLRLERTPADDRDFVGWRRVSPSLGYRYTYWRGIRADSIIIAHSNHEMDITYISLAAQDSVFVGSTELHTDAVAVEMVDGVRREPAPERVLMRPVPCAPLTRQ